MYVPSGSSFTPLLRLGWAQNYSSLLVEGYVGYVGTVPFLLVVVAPSGGVKCAICVCGLVVGIFSSKPVQSFKALSIFITLSKAIWSPFWGAKLKWDLCRWAGAVARATIPIQIKLICQRWNRNGGNASQQNSWSFPSAGLPHCCMNFNCNWKWTLNWILLSLTWRLFCWTALICWASSFRGRVEDFCD